MIRSISAALALAAFCVVTPTSFLPASTALAESPAKSVIDRFDESSKSLVAVQFTFASEIRRRDLVTAGVVVGKDGLVMVSIDAIRMQFPDAQLVDFKIIVPREDRDADEIDAEFVGRDERYNVAFVRAKGKGEWTPLTFVNQSPKVGDKIASIGMLPRNGGYQSYLAEGTVGAYLRGATPLILVPDALAPANSPVFDRDGRAIGVVFALGQPQYLSTGMKEADERNQLAAINSPPRFFVPAAHFLPGVEELIKTGKIGGSAFVGIVETKGLTKDVSQYYGLENQPALQVVEVAAGKPADVAGLKAGMIITKLNGQPLERGTEIDDLPEIFGRNLSRASVGSQIKLTVLPAKDQPLQEIVITTTERPMRANVAARYFAEDLGFGVREQVFEDSFERKLNPEDRGLPLSAIRPQSAGQVAGLTGAEVVMQLNGTPVSTVEDFKKSYETLRKDKPKDPIILVVKRMGKEDTVRIEPPQ